MVRDIFPVFTGLGDRSGDSVVKFLKTFALQSGVWVVKDVARDFQQSFPNRLQLGKKGIELVEDDT